MEDIHDPTKDVILFLNDVKPEEVNQFIEDNERLSTVVDIAGAWKPVKNTEDKISIIQHLSGSCSAEIHVPLYNFRKALKFWECWIK